MDADSTVSKQEIVLRDALQSKGLQYILDFLRKQCDRSLEQIFDSSRRSILYQQLDHINNHEDNNDDIHFELFDIQDFVFIVEQIDKKLNTQQKHRQKQQHSIKYEEYKQKLQTKKAELKEIIELRIKWMKLLIDERKNMLFKDIENVYDKKLNNLYESDMEMIGIINDVEIQYNKFNEFNVKGNESNDNDKEDDDNKFDFEERNDILLKIQNQLLDNKSKLEKIENIINNDIICFNDITWSKKEFENIISAYMIIKKDDVCLTKDKVIKKTTKHRSKTCYNGPKGILGNFDEETTKINASQIPIIANYNDDNNNDNDNLLINKIEEKIKCDDVGWSDKYKGKDIVINDNQCILSNNSINQSIIINKPIPKGNMMKYEMKLDKNGGSGCYFIGVISDIDKCDFNGIAMYGKSLINAFGFDDTNKWIYRGSNGIDIVEWKKEIKTGDILTIITEYKSDNQLFLWFTLNNNIALKPDDSLCSMKIPKQKLSSDYKWHIAISLIEPGSNCTLQSCSIIK